MFLLLKNSQPSGENKHNSPKSDTSSRMESERWDPTSTRGVQSGGRVRRKIFLRRWHLSYVLKEEA